VVVVTVFRVQCARVTARAATDVVLVVPPQVGRPLPLIDEITPLGDADPGSVVPLCDLSLYRAQMNSAFPSDTVDLRVAMVPIYASSP
jgi:hypothetical protein